MLKVGIFLFPDVETLDFCGPLEVFSAANLACDAELFEVYTFAATTAPLCSINGLSVNPDYDFVTVPVPDILVLPGGSGSRRVVEEMAVLATLDRLYDSSRHTFSVCSGARIPAVLGWLDGQDFTTHHSVFEDVRKLAPLATARPDRRFVDNGKFLSSAGVSAGIDLSLYLLEKLQGREIAEKTARYMEYPLLS